MKRFLSLFSILLLLLLSGCQQDQGNLPVDNTVLSFSDKAKIWFEDQDNSQLIHNLEFYGNPDWENFTQIEDKFYFPLVADKNNKNTSKDSPGVEGRNIYIKSFLVLNKKGENNFEGSMKVYFNASGEDIELDYNNHDQSFLHYDSNNQLKDYYLSDGIEAELTSRKDNENLLTASEGEDCTAYFVVATTNWSDGTSTSEVIFSYTVCMGGGGSGGGSGDFGGGGGGGFGDNSPFNEFLGEVVVTPPSCESFYFESVGSNWQAATVTGFQFACSTLLADGNLTIYRIRDYINQTISFETWKTDRFNNSISPGAAAELAAQALNEAIKDTAHHFKDKWGFSETQVRVWFENRVKNEFSTITDGGRITFRDNRYNQTPTQYRTTLFGSDNCQ